MFSLTGPPPPRRLLHVCWQQRLTHHTPTPQPPPRAQHAFTDHCAPLRPLSPPPFSQNGSLMCRFAAPTAWNFYHIIRFACKPCVEGRMGKCDPTCECAVRRRPAWGGL